MRVCKFAYPHVILHGQNTKADVLKQFLKEHKTKWKKDDSLRELLKFLQEQK